ncbi:MAG TPA: hypothetical protein DD664_02335 [Janibacter terrae]|nr:hypothetical protein [Janibacter terrae]
MSRSVDWVSPSATRRRRKGTMTPVETAAALAARTNISCSAPKLGCPCVAAETLAASTAAVTALALEVPTERSRVFRPLAAAVSVTGTERMMSVGSAE